MGPFLRRCRGVVVISPLWGLVWAVIFGALVLVVGLVDPDSIDVGEGPLRVSGIGAFFGFVSGSVFGTLLSFAERGKSMVDLSLWRVALWGMIGTAVYPLLTQVDNGMLLIVCPIGGVLAAALVGLAKKGL